jgi:quinone-modifying oxidoreductase subunit QmoC
MQVARSLAVEELAWPRFVGRLVGKAATTWLLLLAVPLVFWIAAVYLYNGLEPPTGANWAYGEVVPHWLIYAVYFPTFFLAMGIPAFVGGSRAWKMWAANNPPRSGSFVQAFARAAVDIVTHKKFGSCEAAAQSRRWGHFLIMWGFIGAAAASTFIVIWMYGPVIGLPTEMVFPIVQSHPFKILGNLAAISLVIGGVLILAYRMRESSPRSGAFDNLLLAVVLAVIATGVLSELGRIFFSPSVAMWIYIFHLSSVLCLFLSVPYSKFAHLVYRTLAMTHERMLGAKG